MKLIILAAGRGRRLGDVTDSLPKPLVHVNGRLTILESNISKAIRTKAFDQIVVVTGYKSDMIEEAVNRFREEIKILTIYNPFYMNTSPIISLWTSIHKMEEGDFIIMNGDTLYSERIFKVIDDRVNGGIQLIISTRKNKYKDDVQVKLDTDETVLEVSKQIEDPSVKVVSAGFLLVKGEQHRMRMVQKIVQMVKIEKYVYKGIWHEIVNTLVQEGYIVTSKQVDEGEWQEIDTLEDLRLLQKLV